MPKINVLDKQVAELIAAGEVVERPSSVIKELMENAIDAGASCITVEIRNGGVTFMRVTDNGCGIMKEDIPKAFLRHATSKVLKKEDLDAIGTLGFRGEALASISAVSRVELITKTSQEEMGSRYFLEKTGEYRLEDAGCPDGTTIVIRDLFYNVPARMKFLKKDVTEANAVAGIVDKIALSHPEVEFKFMRDGKQVLHSLGDGKMLSSIYAVYGKEFSSSLIQVEYEMGGIRVLGYVTKPENSRPNRSMQNFFINNRYVKSRTAAAALEQAVKGAVMAGKFPGCVLNINTACETVDVNVHPAKIEVRFINEKPIFDAVYYSVKSALSTRGSSKRMEMKRELSTDSDVAQQPIYDVRPVLNEPRSTTVTESTYTMSEMVFGYQKSKMSDREFIFDKSEIDITVEDKCVNHGEVALEKIQEQELEAVTLEEDQNPIVSEEIAEKSSILIGEAFKTYIILEYGDGLMLVDKHAAHERIIYERLKKRKAYTGGQMLLEPVAVTLEKNEYSAILSNAQRLIEMGFEVEDFGVGTVLVRTVPMMLDKADVAMSIMEIAGYLVENKSDINTGHMDWIHHNVACRAAIKGGDISSNEELAALACMLEENPEIRHCPHGRPVSVIIDKKEIEKQFGRIK